MSLKDPIDCNVEKFYEGDVLPGRSISECLMTKMGASINGIKKAWKLECKTVVGNGSLTTPDQLFGVFAVAHTPTSNFNLNTINGNVIALAGQEGFSFLDNLQGGTTYSVTSSGSITFICMGC